jgi:PAS domain S-box-containing protein
MASTPVGPAHHAQSVPLLCQAEHQNSDPRGAHLLLEAFQMFTQASNSLEAAYQQLQARAKQLSIELEAKNRELKKSLREKEEVQNYLKNILESLPCGVLVLDEDRGIRICNPVAADILGQAPTRSIKKPRRQRKLRRSGLRDYLASSLATHAGKKEVEIPFVSEGRMRILATSGTALKNSAGEIIATLHIIRDITEVKELEAQSKRVERLSAMGEMAVELAHEIRNPLGSIELFASLLEKESPKGSDSGRWAENIRVGSRSLNNIVSNMLQFANPIAPKFEEVDVHEVIEETLRFTEGIIRQRNVRLESRLNAEMAKVYGDRELLKQMILNLVLNSMQAMPSKGALIVATRELEQLPGGAFCEGIEIKVEDTGMGIPPENLSRIFDPFFTTNKNGTGLGLSVVHQIVGNHSGFIHVESTVNQGTTFTITLPRARVISGAA